MLLLLRKKIRLNIDVLCDDCEQCMLNLAKENGESHAAHFIRDHNKAFVRDAKLDTIGLLSYFTKCRLCEKNCFNKG